MTLRKFIVSYELPYIHRVEVGIEATDEEDAVAIAQSAFDDLVLWDDQPDMPLLYDEYEEDNEAGVPLEFKVVPYTSDHWPAHEQRDGIVRELKRRTMAFRAARALIDAYQKGEANGGSVDWEDLDEAYRLACEACARPHEESP